MIHLRAIAVMLLLTSILLTAVVMMVGGPGR